MNIILYIFTILVLVSLLAVVILLILFIGEAFIRGHSLPTSKKAGSALISLIRTHKPDAKTIYDLGCAHGSLSLRLKEAFPQKEIVGIDSSYIRICIAQLRAWISKKDVVFIHGDIFQTDLNNTDVVYTYLWFDLMPPLEKKLQRELREGTVVITNTSHFNEWELEEKIETYHGEKRGMPDHDTLFVYVKE